MQAGDLSTFAFRAILKLFGAGHPKRFASGVIIGILLNQVRKGLIATDFMPDFLSVFDEEGVFAAGFAIAFASLLWRCHTIEENLSSTFAQIEEILYHSKLDNELDRRAVYRLLLNKVVESWRAGARPIDVIPSAEMAVEEYSADKRGGLP